MIGYYTSVLHLPATPLGLLHRCSRCHQPVAPEQLIGHAREHEQEVVITN
jgi:hypothetical protein